MPYWISFSLPILILFLVGFLCYYYWIKNQADEYEQPEQYTVENISLGGTYSIFLQDREQIFSVLIIRGKDFFIEVLPDIYSDAGQTGRSRFSGWTSCVPSNRFIRKENLREHPRDTDRLSAR